MKNTIYPPIIRSIIFTAMLSMFPMTSFAGKFEDGLAAYNLKNYSTALKLWRPLAEAGNNSAQIYLGEMYMNGYGVVEDDSEGAKWIRKAAEQGNATAQNYIASRYREHELPLEAVKWYRKAADQGDMSGQFLLADMYLDGVGVPQNYVEAARWYQKSADQGDGVAQVALSKMYEEGKGVRKNYARAYMWLNLAASQYPTVYTKYRDDLVNSMTPNQIAEGQKLSLEWKPKKPK